MKILYGNVIEQHAGWGAEWFMNQALINLGHSTYCIDYRKYRDRLGWKFLRAPICDGFFLQRGENFPIHLVRSANMPRVLWVSELISRRNDTIHLLQSGLFEHVFFRTPTCIDTVVSMGWLKPEQCSIMLSAFDETFHHKTGVEKDIDVLFIGNLTTRRQATLDRLWDAKVVVKQAYGQEMVDLVNRAKIVLNIHSEEYEDTETRVYEVLGCGSFLLTEHLSAENPFSSSHMAVFSNIEEANAMIRYYLSHPEEREEVAEKGYGEALAQHTYRTRAKQIINVFEKCCEGEGAPSYNRKLQLDYFLQREAAPLLSEKILHNRLTRVVKSALQRHFIA